MKYLIFALCLSFSSFAQESFSPLEGRFPENIKDKDTKEIQEQQERVRENRKAHDHVRGKNADPQLDPIDSDLNSKEGAVD